MRMSLHDLRIFMCCRLLSRTHYQHAWGTRATLDFVEVPSTLFENFLWHEDVLREFARNPKTGEPIPTTLVRQLNKEYGMSAAMDLQHSLALAEFDIQVHEQYPLPASPQKIMEAVFKQHSLLPPPADTHQFTTFTHTVGYAAGYYSYMFCRTQAAGIWQTMFKDKPLSAEAGRRLQQEMLQHGGARDPRAILSALIGEMAEPHMLIKHLGLN